MFTHHSQPSTPSTLTQQGLRCRFGSYRNVDSGHYGCRVLRLLIFTKAEITRQSHRVTSRISAREVGGCFLKRIYDKPAFLTDGIERSESFWIIFYKETGSNLIFPLANLVNARQHFFFLLILKLQSFVHV